MSPRQKKKFAKIMRSIEVKEKEIIRLAEQQWLEDIKRRAEMRYQISSPEGMGIRMIIGKG